MPEMVYIICKLAGAKDKYRKEEFKKLITLGHENTTAYDRVFKFSLDCNFIKLINGEKVSTDFTEEQLRNFNILRFTIADNIFKEKDTAFTLLVKWYLGQQSNVFSYKSAEELKNKIPREIEFGINIEKDFILGFRYWAVALGLATFQKAGAGSTLVFGCNNNICDWLKFKKPFESGKKIPVKMFINQLIIDSPQYLNTIKDNRIKQSLSMALRILNNQKIIELKYIPDTSDIWHLTNSIQYPETNMISEIIVR
ncbi:MAG: hypothetical protein WCL51_01340 [Bacteroidota bacterium]